MKFSLDERQQLIDEGVHALADQPTLSTVSASMAYCLPTVVARYTACSDELLVQAECLKNGIKEIGCKKGIFATRYSEKSGSVKPNNLIAAEG